MLDRPNQAYPTTTAKYSLFGLGCCGLIRCELICMRSQDTLQKPQSHAGQPLYSTLAFHLYPDLLYSLILFLHTSTHSHYREQKNNRHPLQNMTSLARDFICYHSLSALFQDSFSQLTLLHTPSIMWTVSEHLLQKKKRKKKKVPESFFVCRLYDYFPKEVIWSETSGI